jgi:hypothetical protein
MSEYVRTKTGIYKVLYRESMPIGFMYHIEINPRTGSWKKITDKSVIKEADNIKELCDRFIVYVEDLDIYSIFDYYDEAESYFNALVEHPCILHGVLETDKGLIYAAKLNDERDLKQL